MTKQEVIELYRDEIISKMKECTEESLRSNGKVTYAIYAANGLGVIVFEDSAGRSMAPDPDCKLEFDKAYFITEICEDFHSLVPDCEDEDKLYSNLIDDENSISDAIIDYVENFDFEQQLDEIIDDLYYED